MERWGFPENWGYQTWTQNSKEGTEQGCVIQDCAVGLYVTRVLWRVERAFLYTVTFCIIKNRTAVSVKGNEQLQRRTNVGVWRRRRWCAPVSRSFCKIAKCEYQLCHVCPSAWNSSAPTGQIFVKFDIWVFFKNLFSKFTLHYITLQSDKNSGTLGDRIWHSAS
jgi:hypothetical protein